jgi:antitoxin VapB
MSEAKLARLFTNGKSQAVRLPKEFRFAGDRVRVSRLGDGVLLEPVAFDVKKYFARIDRFGDAAAHFLEEGREQPPMPQSGDLFD